MGVGGERPPLEPRPGGRGSGQDSMVTDEQGLGWDLGIGEEVEAMFLGWWDMGQ